MPSTQIVVRSARMLPELGPAEPVEIAAAPSAPEPDRGWLAALLPGLSAIGMLGFALLSPNVLIIALCGSVAVLSAGAAVWSARHQRRRRNRQWAERRSRYLEHLDRCARQLVAAERRQREYALAVHPCPGQAGSRSRLLWSRRPGDADFLQVRVGVGRCPSRRTPRLRSGEGDPDGDRALLRLAADLVARHGALDDLPLTIDLAGAAPTIVAFDQMSLLRAVLVSLVAGHGPDVVRLHTLSTRAELQWIGALPHSGVVSHDGSELMGRLRAELRHTAADSSAVASRHVVVLAGDEAATREVLRALAGSSVSDTGPASGDARAGLTVIALFDRGAECPREVTLTASADADGGITLSRLGERPRAWSVARADSLSHAEAHRFAEAITPLRISAPEAGGSQGPVLLAALLEESPIHRLRIPIGRDDDLLTSNLDLREAGQGGDGPHGLVIGATGSGKSELLRSLLVAAAHQSPPQELAFLLVDYKGGAAFSELAGLPHTAGLVTNLNSDRHEIDRLCASLRAELRRRQRLLRDAGVDDHDAYRARRAGPLPRLLVVVDEYAELIEESPEVLDVLTSIGRLGRSLGIHLLLASQRLDDGRLRGLDAHLRFRLCLRTSSAAESVAVIGSPLAAALPSAPGWAWLRRDGALTRLRVALVERPADAVLAVSRRYGSQQGARWTPRPVCLPSLPVALTLSLSAKQPIPSPHWQAHVGLLDLPESGEQAALTLDLTGPAAQLAIAGAPRSGRSTALATVITGLADSTPSRALSIHVVTSATSPLAGTAGLPHVGTVATTRELAGRVIRAVAETVAERHAAAGFDRARDGHLLLVIDDLNFFVAGDETMSDQLARIATGGLSVGVSIALSCGRWSELRGSLRDVFGSRWELRLNDSSDSNFPQLTRRMTHFPAGRILTNGGEWAQVALPRADDQPCSDGLPDALAELVAALARRGGRATRPIQSLPDRVWARALPSPGKPGRLPIGVAGTYAEPVEVSFAPGDHLIVLGNSGSGRSGLLRSVSHYAGGWGARLWLVDPRRTLTLPVNGPVRRASTPEESAHLLEELSALLASKHGECDPAHDVLVIDDLDLASGRFGAAPFAALADLLPFATDLGLSVVVARRVSGSSRAAFDPFFGRLLEFCDTSVLLSGDPSEGPVLGGLRPRPQSPGRGHLIRCGEPAGELQTAWLEPGSPSEPPAAHPLRHPTRQESH